MRTLDKASKLRLAASLITALALSFLGVAAWLSRGSFSLGSFAVLLLFGSLAALATNLDVEARDGFAMTVDVMISMASVVVFQARGVFVGAALVGLFVALYAPHIKNREWHKLAINASAECLSLLAASAVSWSIAGSGTTTPLLLIVATAASAAVYLMLNAVILSIPVAVGSGERYRAVLSQLGSFDVGAFPFALLAVGFGWVYVEWGPAVLVLAIAPILIARQAFKSYVMVATAQEQTIETLILALEAKDRYTAGHAQRVATFCEYVGEEMRFGQRRMERLRYAALMHDIGKLIVPNQILNKPGRLTEAEFERVKRHEAVSVDLLRRIDFLAPVAGDTTTAAATAAVDGSRLIEPAIIHVADAFDAMTSTRSYRRALSQETAFVELRAGSGTQFNAECVQALISAIERRYEYYGAGHEVEAHDWAVAPPEVGTGSAGLGHLAADERVTEEQAAGS
jgi:hypothetical protein